MHEISEDSVFADSSPQKKILQWIIYDDTMAMQCNTTSIIQRYVMMALFYGVSGENWRQNEEFRSNNHEGDFHGVQCTKTKRMTGIFKDQFQAK